MPTLPSYRRDLALKASTFKLLTTGVLYSGSYGGAASGSDAARRVVSSMLGNANLAGTQGEIPGTAYDYQWLYVPSTAEQRRIVKNGYSAYNAASDVLTGHNASADAYIVGYVTVDRAFASTLSGNIDAEILGRFPALSYEETPGLHWAINEALQVMHRPRKETVTGNGTKRIDVSSSFAWLKRPEQLIRVFDVDPASGDEPQVMRGRSWLEPDGEKMYLHIPEAVTSGATFTIQVQRPCSTWIRSGGTWATSTVGLVNETDEALPEVDRVTAVAYWQLCLRMARRGPKPQQADWEAEAKQAAAEAAPFVQWQVEAPTPYTGPRIPKHPTGRSWRPVQYGRRRWP